jgi:hypothetical protein
MMFAVNSRFKGQDAELGPGRIHLSQALHTALSKVMVNDPRCVFAVTLTQRAGLNVFPRYIELDPGTLEIVYSVGTREM